jgi:hypothetical protein
MDCVLKPDSDPTVKCFLRVWLCKWTGKISYHVFMHPEEWRGISLWYGTPMHIRCGQFKFPSLVAGGGEYFSWGLVESPEEVGFDLVSGDHDPVARVDWDAALPELVRDELMRDEQLLAAWKRQPVETIREQINVVRRARKASVQMDRQLALIAELRALA